MTRDNHHEQFWYTGVVLITNRSVLIRSCHKTKPLFYGFYLIIQKCFWAHGNLADLVVVFEVLGLSWKEVYP